MNNMSNDDTLKDNLINQLTFKTRELSGLLLKSEIQFSSIVRKTTVKLLDIQEMSKDNEEICKTVRDIIRDLNSDILTNNP